MHVAATLQQSHSVDVVLGILGKLPILSFRNEDMLTECQV